MSDFTKALDRVWFHWLRNKPTLQQWRDTPVVNDQPIKETAIVSQHHKGKFVYFLSPKNRQWYFRLLASNGKIICQSEGYKRKANVLNGIEAVIKACRNPVIEHEPEA